MNTDASPACPIARGRPWRAAGVLGTALLLAACIPLQQYRTETNQVCVESAPNSPEDRCAVERRTYPIGDSVNEYYFATVEFDDRGWFWDRAQMESTLRFLFDRPDEEFLIFAFAHGWQHRSEACDNNVVCFQHLLERLDFAEREFAAKLKRQPRKIVGVYLGWSGLLGSNAVTRVLSFYNRKRASDRVGIGGVTELLTRLDDLRRFKNPRRDSAKTQLVIAGHSFGGQVIYKALSHALIGNAVNMESFGRRGDHPPDPESYVYDVARSFGDLVILVNPAFEGAAFESLQFAATNRCYEPRQRPSMIIVTSTADNATKTAFPAGRALSNAFSRTRCRDQKKALLKTVGHLERYTTHILELRGAPAVAPPKKLEDQPDCGCPYLKPIDQIQDWMRERDREFLERKAAILEKRKLDDGKVYELGHPEGLDSVDQFRWASYGLDQEGEEMILRRVGDDDPEPGYREYAANYPYLVIQTDKYFIPSHSAVYSERFMDFVRRFYLRHLAGASRDEQLNFPAQCYGMADRSCLESPITPCQRSWTGRPDLACQPGPDGRPK